MRDTNWEAILADIPQIPGLLSAIFRLIEAHRNEIRAQPASFRGQSFGLFASKPFPCVYPATRPLQGPLWRYLTASLADQSGGGRRQ